jgi:ribonuclease E
MVLESNRDLVLRRLTESLARDRTRHQVSEVTSLGLVQLTRKKLGTGLIEAFSTQCTHCAGRGILLHGDPVDSTSAGARKSDSGGRRGKRGKKGGKADEVEVAKVPAHPAGEHPMFKAMAAANGKHEHDEDTDGEVDETKTVEEVAELEPETIRRAYVESEDEELEDDDFDESDEDESDEDESDEDEIDLDADDEDDDIDDDIEVINGDSDESDDDEYDEDDSDEDDGDDSDDDLDDDSDDDDDHVEQPAAVTAPGGRHRRRAAVRPAGPPTHDG